MRFSKITSVGTYLPEKVVTNEELSNVMKIDVERYLGEKGIKVRFCSSQKESTSDLAAKAAESALSAAGIDPGDVDLLIIATDTPDFLTPPTSVRVQEKIGAKNAGCFDINAACADETIALSVASHFIMMGEVDTALVIGSYTMTKWLDWRNYRESVSKVLGMLFGDGAGCVVLTPSEKPGYILGKTRAEGNFWDTYGIYMGSSRPPTEDMLMKRKHLLRFHENGHRVPKDFNPTRWKSLIKETLKEAGLKPEDVKLFLFNQVSKKDIEITMEMLGVPKERAPTVMDRFGYTGSSSTFFALKYALEKTW